MKILVSRVDNIGDVILTLPLCGWLKKNIENAEIHFLCKKRTYAIVQQSNYIDTIHIWEGGELPNVDIILHIFPSKEIAKQAKKQKIPTRVGTSHRIFHWLTCNKLVSFTRKKSDLHEAQLNFKLLKGIGYDETPNMNELHEFVGWRKTYSHSPFIKKGKFNLIFHIKSRGSAKEWHSKNYLELAHNLPITQFNIILTGTQPEGVLIHQEISEIFNLPNVQSSIGKLSLDELIQLIKQTDGLLACSTGPLHIAGISNIHTLGLFPDRKPIHAGRWAPIGEKTEVIEENGFSEERYLKISPREVQEKILNWV